MAIDRALTEWRKAPMAASTIERLIGRLQSADAELHVRIERNEQQPATIHVSGRRTRSASSAGLFALGSQGDSNGVTLSSDGPRIAIDVLWNRDANGGETQLTGAAEACGTLDREWHEEDENKRWDWEAWRATFDALSKAGSLWLVAHSETARWLRVHEDT